MANKYKKKKLINLVNEIEKKNKINNKKNIKPAFRHFQKKKNKRYLVVSI